MRIDGTTYQTMRDAMRDVLAYAQSHGMFPSGAITSRELWSLWNTTCDQLQYDDSHPGFTRGIWVRIVPCNPTPVRVMLRDTNDNHQRTAMRRIAGELGLILTQEV